jgi:hypothetical protein
MYFPPGVYRINQYKITGTTKTGLLPNGITDFMYINCNDLKIIGYNAKIDLKGDFDRTADQTYIDSNGVKHGISYSNSVIPFFMNGCTNFSIQGFEINGNVDHMTRDWNDVTGFVDEGSCSGILTGGADYKPGGCKDYNISNVYVHHTATDGLQLGGGVVADRNAYLHNVRSSNNARDAGSIIQLRGGTFVECIFENTGAQGTYPNHAGSAGVDIEPDYGISTQPPVDVNTGELHFIRCSFHSNFGAQISAALPNSVDNVFFHDCSIKAESPPNPWGAKPNGQLYLAIDNGIMENCHIDLGPYNAALSIGQTSKERTTIRNCTIYTRGEGLVSAPLETVGALPSYVLVEGCKLIGQHTTQLPASSFMPHFNNSQLIFRNNYVFIPKEAYAGCNPNPPGWTEAYHKICSLKSAKLCENNVYETTLIPTSCSLDPKCPADPTKHCTHFATVYDGAVTVKNEVYKSGTAFRPFAYSTWDTSIPYHEP